MSKLVESLKRLYIAGSIDGGKLDSMLNDGKITKEELDYILGV